MSLLNDALRKRQSEHRPPEPPGAAAAYMDRRGRRLHNRHRAAGIILALLVVSAAIAWTWRPWEDAEQPPTQRAPLAAIVQGLPVAAADESPATPSPMPAPTAPPLDMATPAPPAPAAPLFQSPESTSSPLLPRTSTPPRSSHEKVAAPVRRPHKDDMSAAQPSPLPARRITSPPLYEKARMFQRQGRAAEALAMYREVLKLDPDHFDARLNMSSIYLQTDQFTQAYALAAELHRRAPTHLQAILNLAIAQIGCGRAAEALPLLDQAAALPQAPLYTIYFHQGVALRQMGRTEAAIDWYRKAESLNPGDPRLLFNLALAFDQNQSYGQAVAYYSKYLNAAGKQMDAAGRAQVQARVRTLQAELAAVANGENTQ